MPAPIRNVQKPTDQHAANGHLHFLYFSELLKRPVVTGSVSNKLGKLTDLVFAVAEPYPELMGIYIEHGWGKPTEFVPWEKVAKIEKDAIFVQPANGPYPPFVDQPGWILVDKHLMGRTILDIDGRRTEVVNDVRLVDNRGRLLLVDVDLSFNGFLRRWGLGSWRLAKEHHISWKYVQPLSLEDAVPTDSVKLSVTREQLQDLPGEDLADALEELTGKEQQALFSALEPDKAAETLSEAEPRAQRQLIEDLTPERARAVFEEMTVLQIANVCASLPHEKMRQVTGWLPHDRARLVRNLLTEREAKARDMVSSEFVAQPLSAKVRDVLKQLHGSGYDAKTLSYVYVVAEEAPILQGVVDLRDLVLAGEDAPLSDIMISPVVSAQDTDLREDLEELFEKYGFGMVPVVDDDERLLGVIRYNDVMKAPEMNT